MSGSRTRRVKEQLQRALRKERLSEALDHYQTLERMEPGEPRWPHRKGDLLKRLGRPDDSILAYERAVDLYAQQGFVARAAAMAKVIMGINPDRVDVLERVTPDAARKLHRSARAAVVTAHSDPGDDDETQTKRLSRDAVPLVADESAADASRFSRPPSAERIHLDISVAELSDRQPDSSDLGEHPSAEHLAQLPSMPLFAEVPQPVLSRLVRESRLLDLEPGEVLIERGTTADALFVLVGGSVQLIRPQDEDTIVLAEGDVVGISCLLNRVSYEGDVTACTTVRVLRISKLLLDSLVEEYPALGDVLLEVLGRRLVATLVRTSPIFSGLDADARSEVAAMFGVRRADMGTVVLEAGRQADGLYIPMIGRLTAVREDGEELGALKLGRALGRHSMLTGAPSPLTVRADTDVLLLRLSARRFKEMVDQHPEMVAHLEELARRPSAPTFSLIPERRKKSTG